MYVLRTLVSYSILSVVIAVLIFAPAGRWDLWNVWAYVGIVFVLYFLQTLALYLKSPELLNERLKPAGRDRAQWQGIGGLAMLVLHWLIAGLDQRFDWSDHLTLAGVATGLVIFAIGQGLTTWSVLVNPFFSSVTRIQADRGQRVISEGPYAIVRHPGYTSILLAVIASGIALNSLLSIIPAIIFAALYIHATAIEDRMLLDELAGYADYAAKVRYRLIPGVW